MFDYSTNWEALNLDALKTKAEFCVFELVV